jgi:hypothetical protein
MKIYPLLPRLWGGDTYKEKYTDEEVPKIYSLLCYEDNTNTRPIPCCACKYVAYREYPVRASSLSFQFSISCHWEISARRKIERDGVCMNTVQILVGPLVPPVSAFFNLFLWKKFKLVRLWTLSNDIHLVLKNKTLLHLSELPFLYCQIFISVWLGRCVNCFSIK